MRPARLGRPARDRAPCGRRVAAWLLPRGHCPCRIIDVYVRFRSLILQKKPCPLPITKSSRAMPSRYPPRSPLRTPPAASSAPSSSSTTRNHKRSEATSARREGGIHDDETTARLCLVGGGHGSRRAAVGACPGPVSSAALHEHHRREPTS